jgi:8-oxo-dGTP diphosphatase
MPSIAPDFFIKHLFEMSESSDLVHVAAAVIENARGHILLTRRHDHVHQGGLWEFPGGKLEQDEMPKDALARELHEEIGIEVKQARPLIRVYHDYGDRKVLLDVWKVTEYSGLPHGKEGQALEWSPVESLGEYPMPAADVPIVNAVSLPDLYLVTPEPEFGKEDFLIRLEAALQRGVRLVQLRAYSLSREQYISLASEVLESCRYYDASLILNADPDLLNWIDADGIHLNRHRLMALDQRPAIGDKWLSASCHNQEEVMKANQVKVDFAVLSPVMLTSSHPETEPMGWPGFWDLAEQANFPVYALGGLSIEHLHQAFVHGAQGVAAITGLWDE